MRCVFTIFLLLGAAISLRAEDWPQRRGASAMGFGTKTGSASNSRLRGCRYAGERRWGRVFRGRPSAGGRVFLMDREVDQKAPAEVKTQWNFRDKTAGQERVVCLDEATGKVLWTRSYPCVYSVAYGSGPRATPTVCGDRLYTLGAMGDLLCLDTATGRIVWQKNFVRDYQAQVPLYGMASPPLVDGPRLIVVVGGQGQAVVALDRNSGKEAWKAGDSSEPGYCAPLIRTLGGQRQLIVWNADALLGLEPESGPGALVGAHPIVVGMAITTPAIEGDRLAVSSQYEGTWMLEFKPGEVEPAVLWKASAGTSPERQWKKAGFNTTLSTVLLLGGHVYGVSLYGETCCLDGNTGRRVWTTLEPTSGGTVPRERWSTLFMVPHGEQVVIFNEKGDLILARLSPAGYQELSRTHIIEPDMASSGNAGRKVVWSHPAFAERCVYARNNHEIVCLSLASRPIVQFIEISPGGAVLGA